MPDSKQFVVTRIDQNTYKVFAQNETGIIRSQEIPVSEIMDKLGYELEQLISHK